MGARSGCFGWEPVRVVSGGVEGLADHIEASRGLDQVVDNPREDLLHRHCVVGPEIPLDMLRKDTKKAENLSFGSEAS
jgi:hypothetical protein